MKILVTGAAGFIGFSLTRRLLEQGHEVVGLDNINSYYDTGLKYARLKELGIAQAGIHEAAPVQSALHPGYRFTKLDLADRIGIVPERTVAFGDSLNDKSLLAFTPNSVAMANAIPELRAAAAHVCRPNTEDGVARFVAEHIL